MKSFTKKCRGCLWPGSYSETGLEEERAPGKSASGLVWPVLERSSAVVDGARIPRGVSLQGLGGRRIQNDGT